MASGDSALAKLQEYAQKVKNTEHPTPSASEQSAYGALLDVTLEDFSSRVKVEAKALEELRANGGDDTIDTPSTDPITRLKQLRIIKAAYQNLAHSEPELPSPESPIPALLAIRNAQRQVVELADSISATHQDIIEARKRLAQEQADLRDAQLITEALKSRVASLTLEVQQKSQITPDEAAQIRIKEEGKRTQSIKVETRKLVKALVKFINEQLAGMLAAEDLGGPVVGSLLEVSDDMLAAGFSHRGKAKKPKLQKNDSETDRQARIDHIWGRRDNSASPATERKAAAAETRLLTEDLLNVAAEEGADAYVTLARDSAASRFLVRAKVAQFDPRDARRLRLIDFGRELDE
ncbi:hypothetical protein MMC13_002739 [Lambiella insularis]|nr:hypothetical protein [Lambiella insularis]